MTVARGREGPPTVEQGQLEEVPLGEVELGERLGLGPTRVGSQGVESPDFLDQVAQNGEPVLAVHLEGR